MATGIRYREGEVAWVDLTTSNIERSGEFYGELFGWDIDDLGEESGGYRFATVASRPVAGLLPTDPEQPIESWTVYLAVDDIDDAYERAQAAGAHPLVAPYALDGHGRYALVADPGGSVLGLWQRGQHAGTQVHSFAGSPGWFENHTKGYDAACAFYRDAFGLVMAPLAEEDDFRYSTGRVEEGEDPAFGVFDVAHGRPAELPSMWAVYFLTADADRDAERAVALGATLTFGPEESVYGRMATLVDPLGAAFNLIEPPLPEPEAELDSAEPVADVDVDEPEGAEPDVAEHDDAPADSTEPAADSNEASDPAEDAVSDAELDDATAAAHEAATAVDDGPPLASGEVAPGRERVSGERVTDERATDERAEGAAS